MMVGRTLPDVEQPNERGSCWSCVELDVDCDAELPRCRKCVDNGRTCPGYAVRLRWPDFMRDPDPAPAGHQNDFLGRSSIAAWSQPQTLDPAPALLSSQASRFSVQYSLSPFGLQPPENDLLQHYIRHISSIALAIDYTSNGYRRLVPMALDEPALLNAILAVAASHRSKWRAIPDAESKRYLRQSLLNLQRVMKTPEIAQRESTLGTMLCLVSYEVFNGSAKWKNHFMAVAGWIKSCRDPSSLHPFLKNWISMIDTQSAMNAGQIHISEIEGWLEVPEDAKHTPSTIDPLFGCSVQLPHLMLEAARLYHLSRTPEANHPDIQRKFRRRANRLQEEVRKTACPIQSPPTLAVCCDRDLTSSVPINELGQPDYARRITATAEIFRHALHVYIGRIVTGPSNPLDPIVQASVDAVFELLPYVPDAIGPGSNLGWALVVIGSETDAPELREYLRCRWKGLSLLEMNNTQSAERLVENVWQRRDMAGLGNRWCGNWRWQEVMKTCGGEQILV